ncbi:MAG: hypothetical protein HQK50_06150 [Oligoflexia bacterium]|nr:hypothetical protein [Oligoflexia bacterium]
MQKMFGLKTMAILTVVAMAVAKSSLLFASGCLEKYEQDASKYAKEIAFIQALEKKNFFYLPEIGPYLKSLDAIPLMRDQDLQILLQIGFKEEIFCSPDVLSLTDILYRLRKGHFYETLESVSAMCELDDPSKSLKLVELQKMLKKLRQDFSPFPQEVHFRNPKKIDLTGNFEWYLNPEDHRIYVRPNRENHKEKFAPVMKGGNLFLLEEKEKVGNRNQWNLHDGTGVPSTLKKGEYIKEFQAASEIVVALSNENRFHMYKPTVLERPVDWYKEIGDPLGQELFLPKDSKAWTFGCSVKEKPDIRYTKEFMDQKDIVHYFEDGLGNKFDFGFTATLFSLDPNGRVIRYTDTGLPGNWSRAFVTPDRGMFQAENISSAGSTMFIVGKDDGSGQRKMYTRMYDYEIMGGCPGNYHSFEGTKDADPNTIHELCTGVRHRPLPGWSEVAPIPLTGKATMSNRIAIFLTGEGNAARELRVLGSNEVGATGYWHKPLYASEWEFAVTGEEVSNYEPSTLAKAVATAGELLPGQSFTYNYSEGSMQSLDTKEKFKATLKDFHWYLGDAEPAAITITTPSGKSFDIALHIVDAWILTAQKQKRDALIGDADGESKILMGSLRVPQEILESQDPEIKSIVDKYLRKFHNQVDKFSVTANDESVSIREVEASYPLTMHFQRERDRRGYYEQHANLPTLIATEKEWSNPKLLEKKIALNQQMLANLDDGLSTRMENFKNGITTGVAAALFPALRFGAKLFGAEKNHPEFGAIYEQMPVTLGPHAKENWSSVFRSQGEGKTKALETLSERIQNYEVRLQELKKE